MHNPPKDKCKNPCKTCPFLTANFGKPNPAGYEPDKENGGMDWYSRENAERLWKEGIREGEFLLCHATDPNSPEYGNPNTPKTGAERVCLGGLALMIRTVNRLGQVGYNYTKYKKGLLWPVNKRGMANFVGNVSFNTSGVLIQNPMLDAGIGVPWDDAVLNSETGLL